MTQSFSIEFQVSQYDPSPVTRLGKFVITIDRDPHSLSSVPGAFEHINALLAWTLGEDHRFKIAMHIWEKSRASCYTDRAVDSVQTWVIIPAGTQKKASEHLVHHSVNALEDYALKYMRSLVPNDEFSSRI